MAKSTKAASKRTGPTLIGGKAFASRLKAAANSTLSAAIWKPEVEGDGIGGEIASMREEDGKFGAQTVLVLLTESGAFTIYANASLKRGLDDIKAKVGDKIGIVFRGSTTTGRGRPFRLFSVSK